MTISNPTVAAYVYRGVWNGSTYDSTTSTWIPTSANGGGYIPGDVITPTGGYIPAQYTATDLLLCIVGTGSGINIDSNGHAQEGNDAVQHWRKLNIMGAYVSGTTYNANDVVYYNGGTHVLITGTSTSIPSNSNPWRQISGYTPPSGIACFLGDAPVLTPAGYKSIATLRAGDLVVTATGAAVPIQAVTARPVAASAAVNPFVIPKGRFGALRDLAISPDHKVAVGDRMVEARALGLQRQNMTGHFTYYNLELPNYENMVVAGVTVESQYPIRRVAVMMSEFREMLVAKYGRLTPAILARVQKKVRLLTDGRVVVPVDKIRNPL